MTLRLPYLPEPLAGGLPPTLPAGSTARWRPVIPVRVIGPTGRMQSYSAAVLDTGADDTLFPLDVAAYLGVQLYADLGFIVRWRGQPYPLRFGDVELELNDNTGAACRWPATVAFSPARLRYPILGHAGCLTFFDARFLGEDRIVELEPNRLFPGTVV